MRVSVRTNRNVVGRLSLHSNHLVLVTIECSELSGLEDAKPSLRHPNETLPDLKKILNGRYTRARSMIDRQLAAFLEEGLGIHIGTRNAAPRAERRARHRGAGRRRRRASGRLRARSRRRRACCPISRRTARPPSCFARPIDDAACQVKGVFVERAAGRARTSARWSRRSGTASCDNLERIGIPRAGWRRAGSRGRRSRSGCGPRRSSSRRPVPAAGAPLA